jgi:hypothetical protein
MSMEKEKQRILKEKENDQRMEDILHTYMKKDKIGGTKGQRSKSVAQPKYI